MPRLSSFIRPHWLPAILGLAGLGAASVVLAQQQDDGAIAALDSSGAFEINGIEVDVAARNAADARKAGYREAIRRGWRMLYGNMTGRGPEAAPRLSDSVLDGLVSGVAVEREQIGPTRYVARLGVLFDRARTSTILGTQGNVLRSPPMLFIPVQVDGSAAQTVGAGTAWQRAWARFRSGGSPVDYIRPAGSGPDPMLLSWGQTRRGDRAWWLAILEQYGASDMLSAEARLDRSWPGGPVVGHFTARHGPDGQVLARFALRAPNAGALDTMLDVAVRRIDGLYAAALRAGRLQPDPLLKFEELPDVELSPTIAPDAFPAEGQGGAIDLEVATADSASFDAAVQLLRGTAGVRSTAVTSLSIGGQSQLRLGYEGSLEQLRYQLDQRGWRLEPGAPYRLRPRAAGEAPLPPPPPPVPPEGTPPAVAPVPGTQAPPPPAATGA